MRSSITRVADRPRSAMAAFASRSIRTAAADAPSELDVLALDDALSRLSALDARQGRVVELRFFAGLDIQETAEVLDVSPATVKRDWVIAKAWLYRALQLG